MIEQTVQDQPDKLMGSSVVDKETVKYHKAYHGSRPLDAQFEKWHPHILQR
jgi:hypothetical protein